ncbi:MAG: hypothetical protein WKG01_02160 [Kofleriaceae bacterium]
MKSSLAFAVLVACGNPPAREPIASTPTTQRERVTDSTLVLFEPEADACVVRRRDPVARTSDELGRIPGTCRGARIAWHPQLDRAVVWFDPGNVLGLGKDTREVRERVFELALASGAIKPVTLPTGDPAREIAYAADGTLDVFSEQEVPKAAGKMTVRGHPLDFSDPSDGMPAAALAFRRTGAGWQLTSVTRTTTGWDYAAGWSAAPEAQTLGPRSFDLLDGHADTQPITDAATRTALDAIAVTSPDAEDDGWTVLATPHGPLYVWMMTGEFTYTTRRLAWRSREGVTPLPGPPLDSNDLVELAVRGRYLLVASSRTGSHPQLYDLVEREQVFASDTALATTFWPR